MEIAEGFFVFIESLLIELHERNNVISRVATWKEKQERKKERNRDFEKTVQKY